MEAFACFILSKPLYTLKIKKKKKVMEWSLKILILLFCSLYLPTMCCLFPGSNIFYKHKEIIQGDSYLRVLQNDVVFFF